MGRRHPTAVQPSPLVQPHTHRWLSEDPIRWNAGDENLYRYVGNGAPNATDPSGLEESRPPGFGARLRETLAAPARSVVGFFDSIATGQFRVGNAVRQGMSEFHRTTVSVGYQTKRRCSAAIRGDWGEARRLNEAHYSAFAGHFLDRAVTPADTVHFVVTGRKESRARREVDRLMNHAFTLDAPAARAGQVDGLLTEFTFGVATGMIENPCFVAGRTDDLLDLSILSRRRRRAPKGNALSVVRRNGSNPRTVDWFDEAAVLDVIRSSQIGRQVLEAAESNVFRLECSNSFFRRSRSLSAVENINVNGIAMRTKAKVFLPAVRSNSAAATTAIHEGVHMLGVQGSRRAEALARLAEISHRGGTIDGATMRRILQDIRNAPSAYGELPWRLGRPGSGATSTHFRGVEF